MSPEDPGRRVRLLVLGGVWPFVEGAHEANNVVTHEILYWLAEDFDVFYGCVSSSSYEWPVEAFRARELLENRGVRFLPLIRTEGRAVGRPRRIVGGVMFGRWEDLIPHSGDQRTVATLLRDLRPDLLLVVWSDLAAGLLRDNPIMRFAYQGNPPHKVMAARLELSNERSTGTRLRDGLWLKAVERAHLKVMRSFDLVGNVAANDAAYYSSRSIDAFYIQNMWPSSESDVLWRREGREQVEPFKIIGNIGNLGATGNTFGLINLAREIVPRLIQRVGAENFEIHLLGGGDPHPSVDPLIEGTPHLLRRGFVPDIESELLSAPVFLVANNHSRFKVGHTRFLHAWALGCCVVAYRDSRVSMPEIEHERNALLARDSSEIADLIARCAEDADLRRRMSEGGLQTLKESFAPERVCREIAERLRSLSERSKR